MGQGSGEHDFTPKEQKCVIMSHVSPGPEVTEEGVHGIQALISPIGSTFYTSIVSHYEPVKTQTYLGREDTQGGRNYMCKCFSQ